MLFNEITHFIFVKSLDTLPSKTHNNVYYNESQRKVCFCFDKVNIKLFLWCTNTIITILKNWGGEILSTQTLKHFQ